MSGRAGAAGLRLAALWAGLGALFAVLVAPQFADPFLRSDDFPALVADPALYEWKTLAKGRWLNWLWLMRDWPTGRHTLFALHMGAWCLVAAAAAAGHFRHERGPWAAAVAAAAVALMPQAADMAAWPATLMLPNLAVAAFALVAALAPFRWMLAALAVLVPLALMGHSTAALTMPVLALMAADWRDPRARVLAMLAVFLAAMALGTLAVFTLNWLAWGHFGLRLEDWLALDPARDAAGLAANAGAALSWLGATLRHMALGQAPLAAGLGALAAGALAWLVAARPAEAVRWLGVAAVVGAVLLAPTVLQGIDTPPRATGPLWLLLVALFAMVARAAPAPRLRGLALGILGAMALMGGVLWHALHVGAFAPYQAMTRELAARLGAAAPGPVARLLVAGEVHRLPATAPLQYAIGFEMRLEDLTGWEVHLCSEQAQDLARGAPSRLAPWTEPRMAAWEAKRQADVAACEAGAAALATLPAWPAPGSVAALAPGTLGLALPGAAGPQEKSEAMPSFSQSP